MKDRAKKTTLLASIGAGLEYYDFIVYGMMVVFLNSLFFSESAPWINQIKAFAIFAVGYLARPFGGVFFGMLGDAFGRKKAFLASMMVMALSTLAIGLLPTYAQAGFYAPILLIVCRLFQGLSFGAELPGAITVVYEHAEKKARSLYSGFVISSVTIGSLLASLVLFLLTIWLNDREILQWGWRIPFLFGGMLAVFNALFRRHLEETPEYLQAESQRQKRVSLKTPLFLLAARYKMQAFIGIGATIFLSSLVIFMLYLPAYLSMGFSYERSAIYLAMTYSMAWSALTLPLLGYLADRWSAPLLFRLATIGFILFAFPLFSLLSLETPVALLAFTLLYQTLLSAATAGYFPLLSSLFPTEVRYTGVALSYNVSYALIGALPIALTILTEWLGPNAILAVLIPSAVISLLASLKAKHQ